MGRVKITWINSVTVGVTKHIVYRDDIEIGQVVVADPSELYDESPTAGTTHKYEVQAVDGNGVSVEEVYGVNMTNLFIPPDSEEPPVNPIPDFYVTSTGNNTDGLTEATAWNSLSSLQSNQGSILAGQKVGLKGGEEFFGDLSITSKSNITINSYGTGKAVITGVKPITGWTTSGGNIWVANTISDTVYQVFKDGVVLTMGRMPKIASKDRPDLSYYTVTSPDVGSKTSFSSSTATGLGATGGKVHISSKSWRLQARTVNNYNSSNGSMTLSSGTSYTLGDGDRFFVNNRLSYCTEQDEWYYSGGQLSMYSTTQPTNISIAVKSGDGVVVTSCDNVTFDNIDIFGYNSNGLSLISSQNITSNEVGLRYNYTNGVSLSDSNFFTFSNSLLEGSNKRAFHIPSGNDDATITDSIIKDLGVFENITYSDADASHIMNAYGKRVTFTNNKCSNLGYIGVVIRGADSIIDKNKIENFCMIMDDGSAYYTHNGDWAEAGAAGTSFTNNIAIGYDFNVKWYANGYYSDDRSHDVTWENNTAIRTYYGFYLHNSADINFRYNNVYDTKGYGLYLQDDTIDDASYNALMKNNIITYNEIFYTQTLINQQMGAVVYRTGWEDYQFGTVDYNKYWVPYYDKQVKFGTSSIHGSGGSWDLMKYDLDVWNSSGGYGYAEGYDANSEKDNLSWTYPDHETKSQCVYNDTHSAKDTTLSGTWYDLDNNSYVGTINLQPFTSKILIQP